MFFEADRIQSMREMIVAKDVESRKKALAKLLPYQQGDFEAMYEVLEGRPMTVRYLDPPLHEFLPQRRRISPPSRASCPSRWRISRALSPPCTSSTR